MHDGESLKQMSRRLMRLLPSAIPFSAIGFRSTTPQYATEADLLSGAGSRIHGGRWTPVGVAAVYVSLTPETAMAESLAHHRYYGIPIEDAMPRTFVAIQAVLANVLDLRDGIIRQRLGVSQERILSVDWRAELSASREPITQTIGRAAHQGEWEGLIAPSAADPGGENLVVFPERLRSGSSLAILHAGRLPGR